jgi:hypothetical protein
VDLAVHRGLCGDLSQLNSPKFSTLTAPSNPFHPHRDFCRNALLL